MSAENTKHTIIIEGVDKIIHVYKNVGDMADKTTQKIRLHSIFQRYKL
jgi:hypothetical protein